MLAGQAINLGDAVVISITGMAIVMLELAILAVFIQVMSKILATIVKGKEEPKKAAAPAPKAAPAPAAPKAAPAPAAPVPQPAVQGFMSSEEEDDLAVIMATVLEESGLPMEQVVFRSIVRVQ